MHSIFWFRTRQWVLSRVLHLTEHKKQTLLAAPDAVLLLPALFRKRRISRILLVTTPGFVRRGTLTSLLDGCKKENISVTIFSEIAPDPQIESVEQGFRLYQQIQAQAILAIGGGSVLDTAKLIGARVCCPKKTVPAMRGLLKVRRKLPPLFAVPTTAGTGSEATAAAVITDCIDGKPYKYAVNDLCLIPDTAVLDPRLTISLPSSMTADTGMDALTHAMEAFLNLFASRSVQNASIEAVCENFHALPEAWRDGSRLAARQEMLHASYLAGFAFTNNFVGYVHAIAHAVGALYHIPHGRANAVLLPAVLREYGSCIAPKLAVLADALSLGGDTVSEKAERMIAAIEAMRDSFDIPSTLPHLSPNDYTEIARRALKDPAFFKIYSFQFLEGSPFTASDLASGISTAVITDDLARRLFGTTEEVVGRSFSLNYIDYRVCAYWEQEHSPVFHKEPVPETKSLLNISLQPCCIHNLCMQDKHQFLQRLPC